LVLAPVIVRADPLELVCAGEATKTEAHQTFGSAYNSNGDSANATVTTYGKARSGEHLRVKLDGAGTASIKLPPAFVPPLHGGGVDGWWPVTELVVTDTQIAGNYRMNFLNKGHFTIDRHTGEIDVSALALKFNGSCEKAAEAPEERKF
jgi:hypothetical protein